MRWAGLRAVYRTELGRGFAERYRSHSAAHCWVHLEVVTVVVMAARCGAHLQVAMPAVDPLEPTVLVLNRPLQLRPVNVARSD